VLPLVFVSSTIEDLQHLRDAIRDAIIDLAYQPVMSEYGDIGYLTDRSAAESCYLTARECQIAILILGKRYGSIGDDGRSVTHNEFMAAREHQVPVICLVDREVLTYKKLFEANAGTLKIPGMESPERTFGLIDEIAKATTNNAVLGFATVHEAKALVKSQIAHKVGNLLRRSQDPIGADVRELLAELKTVRHEIAIGTQAPQFMRAARFLLNEANDEYREIIEWLFGSIENGIPVLLESALFDEVIAKATGRPPSIVGVSTWNEADAWAAARENELLHYLIYGSPEEPERPTASLFALTISRDTVYVNEGMRRQGQLWHSAVREFSIAKPEDSPVPEAGSADGTPPSSAP